MARCSALFLAVLLLFASGTVAQEAATAGTAPPDDSVADTEPIAITPLPQPTGDEIAVAILEATPTPTAQTLPESTPGGVEEAQTTQAPAEVANVVPEEAHIDRSANPGTHYDTYSGSNPVTHASPNASIHTGTYSSPNASTHASSHSGSHTVPRSGR
eukprot:jgi/Tetstr1/459733/TSEL_005086.t1